MVRIVLITTGGTIEKTYDERTGELENRGSIVQRMLQQLRIEGADVAVMELMHKDSVLMTAADREAIGGTVATAIGSDPLASRAAGIVILHGTDTLETTGEELVVRFAQPRVPIVLTGALRPFEMKRSDALQNLTEALFAARTLEPGVYCVAHGRCLSFPGVVKDRNLGTFVKP
jgi:L-asparaginase